MNSTEDRQTRPKTLSCRIRRWW